MQKEIILKENTRKINKGLFLAKLGKDIEKSEEEIINGKIYKINDAFNELRKEFGS